MWYIIIILSLIIIEAIIYPSYKSAKENRKVRKWLGTIRDCEDDQHSGTKKQLGYIIDKIEKDL